MNVLDKSALRACTSCQMCAAICPKNAISIELNRDGFYRPTIDIDSCVNCSLCTQVCYRFDISIASSDCIKLASQTLYGASAKNAEILKKTTSGGVADILAHYLVQNGYKCVGVVYDSENDRAKDVIASSEKELEHFKGSKYIQSYTCDAFHEVVKTCKQDKYAIFGTPCHIYALDKYLRLKHVRDNFLLIDLYCHGCPSLNIWTKYISSIKNKINQPKIDNVNFRSKIKGWGNFYVVVVVDGKPVYYSSDDHNSDFFDLFFSDQVLNDACNSCKLRSTLDYTDIRLGDFWGKQYVFDSRGVSAVSIVTERAKKVFDNIKSQLIFRQEQDRNFLPWQSWGKEHKPIKTIRDLMLAQLRDDSIPLHDTFMLYFKHQSLKNKLTSYIKRFIHKLPQSCERAARWLFYKVKG